MGERALRQLYSQAPVLSRSRSQNPNPHPPHPSTRRRGGQAAGRVVVGALRGCLLRCGLGGTDRRRGAAWEASWWLCSGYQLLDVSASIAASSLPFAHPLLIPTLPLKTQTSTPSIHPKHRPQPIPLPTTPHHPPQPAAGGRPAGPPHRRSPPSLLLRRPPRPGRRRLSLYRPHRPQGGGRAAAERGRRGVSGGVLLQQGGVCGGVDRGELVCGAGLCEPVVLRWVVCWAGGEGRGGCADCALRLLYYCLQASSLYPSVHPSNPHALTCVTPMSPAPVTRLQDIRAPAAH